jgi:hypothetical protein
MGQIHAHTPLTETTARNIARRMFDLDRMTPLDLSLAAGVRLCTIIKCLGPIGEIKCTTRDNIAKALKTTWYALAETFPPAAPELDLLPAPEFPPVPATPDLELAPFPAPTPGDWPVFAEQDPLPAPSIQSTQSISSTKSTQPTETPLAPSPFLSSRILYASPWEALYAALRRWWGRTFARRQSQAMTTERIAPIAEALNIWHDGESDHPINPEAPHA